MSKLFNVNSYVELQLTEEGKEHWKNDFKKYAPKEYKFEEHYQKYTTDGWTKMQLHEVLSLYGGSISTYLTDMFKTTIRINDEDLKQS